MMRYGLLICVGLLLCGGCSTGRIETLAQALNERQVQSCIELQGAYGLFVGIRVLTATGGATLQECRGLR